VAPPGNPAVNRENKPQPVVSGETGLLDSNHKEPKVSSMIRSIPFALAMLLAAGLARAETFAFGGVDRTYTLMRPAKTPAPLVLVLHGNTQQGIDMITRTSWPAVVKREQIAAVFPDGLNRAWADLRGDSNRAGSVPPKGTDDTAFLTALIAKLIKDGIADPKHIYVTGVSNGGAMTMTLVCAQADMFAAAGSVIMNLTSTMTAACKPSRPVPFLMMNGTADPLVAYLGGRGTSRFAVPDVMSTAKTMEFWRRANGCDTGDSASIDLPNINRDDDSTVTRIESRCPQGADVVLYRINGGGHRMPGSFADAHDVRQVNMLLGPQNRDIDGAEVIWAFFKNFALP